MLKKSLVAGKFDAIILYSYTEDDPVGSSHIVLSGYESWKPTPFILGGSLSALRAQTSSDSLSP